MNRKKILIVVGVIIIAVAGVTALIKTSALNKETTEVSTEIEEITPEPTEEPTPEPMPEPTPEPTPVATEVPSSESTEETTNEKDSSDVEESDIEVLDKTMYAQGSVNTRSGPSTDFTKVGGLSTNQEVKVTGKSKSTGWYEIEVNGEKQYVSDRYLADTKITVTEQTSNTSNAGSTNTDNAGNTGTSSSGNTGSTNVGPDSNGNAVLPDSLKGLSSGDAASHWNSTNQGESSGYKHYESLEGIHAD